MDASISAPFATTVGGVSTVSSKAAIPSYMVLGSRVDGEHTPDVSAVGVQSGELEHVLGLKNLITQ